MSINQFIQNKVGLLFNEKDTVRKVWKQIKTKKVGKGKEKKSQIMNGTLSVRKVRRKGPYICGKEG